MSVGARDCDVPEVGRPPARSGVDFGVAPQPALPGQLSSLSMLQRSAGNGAVSRLIASRTRSAPRVPSTDSSPVRGGQPAPTEPFTDALGGPVGERALTSGGGGAVGDSAAGAPPDEPGSTPPEELSGRIAADAAQSEQLVEAAAATNRAQIDTQFGAARAGLLGLVDNTSARVRSFVDAGEEEFTAVSSAVSSGAQTAVTATVEQAQSQADQAQSTLTGMADAATSTAENAVNGVSGRLGGLVDSLPLPNVPGVGALKSGVRALIGRAGGLLSSGLDRVRSLIGAALRSGAALLRSAVNAAGQAARSVLSQLTQLVRRAGSTLFGALRRAASTVTDGVRRAVSSTVLAGLTRVQTAMTSNLATSKRQALDAVRRNRDDHLQVLRSGRATGEAGQRVVEEALQQNASIVATFRERTSSIIGEALSLLASGASALVGRVTQAIGQVVSTVRNAVTQVIGKVRELGQALAGLLGELSAEVSAAIRGAVDTVRGMIDNPVQTLGRVASQAVDRAGQFLRGIAQRVLGGDFSLPSASNLVGDVPVLSSGPITPPPRGPITLPGLRTILIVFALAGALVAYVAPQMVVAVAAALAALGITVSPIVLLAIVGVLAILAIIAILLTLYWLYTVLKPKPAPPPGCTITTKTVARAPDGTADTRRQVGVSELVTLTSSVPATWTASVGAITSTGPSSASWTAPGSPDTATITATPATGGPATVSIKVIQPTGNLQTEAKAQSYAPDLAGSGFVSKVTVRPINVSFSRIKVREETATAKATGYYDTVTRWNGIKHPQGTFMPLDKDNNGQNDTVGSPQPGTPKPFSDGEFHWPIPQSYEAPGGGGGVYSTGDHLQTMTGSAGTETTAKEGATNTRTPTPPPPPPTPPVP